MNKFKNTKVSYTIFGSYFEDELFEVDIAFCTRSVEDCILFVLMERIDFECFRDNDKRTDVYTSKIYASENFKLSKFVYYVMEKTEQWMR